MELIKTSEVFEDIKYFKGKFFPDERGFFKKPFYGSNLDDYFKNISEVLVSKSKKNVIRGLHFQTPPHEVSKIVHCVEGKVKDVFLDLRKDSPTYGKHDSVYLDDDKNITEKPSKVKNDAAKVVKTKNNSTEPDVDESKNYFKESQVDKMSPEQYEKNQEKIMEAIRSGKFIYDLSGSAR